MEKDSLRGFELHGIAFHKNSGDQSIGDCIFCGKEDHFYANKKNKLWDCKRCGEKGGFSRFLELVAERNAKEMSDQQLHKLCLDRRLPKLAFKTWGVGYDSSNASYTVPVRGPDGRVSDLRLFRLGSRTQATPTANLGLLGAERIGNERLIYVCEGEWDTFAFNWLLKNKLGKDGVVVGVPGASVFKNEWIQWFSGKEVVALYDHDAAGDMGHKMLGEKLNGIADLKTIRWPEGLPEGWDIRDHVVKFAIKEGRPKWALKKIFEMLESPQTIQEKSSPEGVPSAKSTGIPTIIPANHQEAVDEYRKWLHLPGEEVLQVMFGAAIANKLQGDPIWLFLVAPPGGSKSELLSSLSKSPLVESTTSLTPHSLVSGAHNSNGVDPSLLPKLNGRILVIKDFTTILSMHYSSRDEIFGVLRDAYDGRTEKIFGTGLKRTYVSHFGIIAGVTPKIEEFGVVHQSLGERFLKYRINTGTKTLSETDRIRRALQNINKENTMREELCKIGNRCLAIPIPKELPVIDDDTFEQIIHLAQVTAMMRGVVERDRYTQQVMYKPTIEVGTRLAKQLAKLSIGIAIYMGKKRVDYEVYAKIRKVALDTAPDRIEEIIRRLWTICGPKNDTARTHDISLRTRLPVATCFRVLQDLELLKLVNRVGTGNKYEWNIHKKMRLLIKGARLYE